MAMYVWKRFSVCAKTSACVGKLESRNSVTIRILCGSRKYSSHSSSQVVVMPRLFSSSMYCGQRISNFLPNCITRSFTSKLCSESSFHQMMDFRQKQARCSILIELCSKRDIPFILNLCKQFGEVSNMIFFTSRHAKFQIIAEFVHEKSVQKLLSDSSLKNVTEVFPVESRYLYFENKGKSKQQRHCNLDEVTDLSQGSESVPHREIFSVSEMMTELYQKEKMSDLSTRLRFLSCVMLQDALKGIFPYCTAFPFGSSVNGFGKNNSDLDIILRLFPEQVGKNSELFFQTKYVDGNSRDLQRRAVYVLGDILHTFIPGVSHVRKILNARVPIVKYNHQLLNLECDISVNNMSAFYMSEILFFCGKYDSRISPLMHTIKYWAKEVNVTYESPGSWITNFSLTLLVLFFLQSRPVPILPPLNKLIRFPDVDDYKSCAVKYANEDLNSLKPGVTNRNLESPAVLLQEFFSFLVNYPFKQKRISVLAGVADTKRDDYAIWIDYPLDETKNVSKNVSQHELQHLCSSASAALKNLEKASTIDVKTTDLISVLGAPGLKQDHTNKIDIRAFLDESSSQEKVVGNIR